MNVSLECWNYRKDGISSRRIITIDFSRHCMSNCEFIECPLYKKRESKT